MEPEKLATTKTTITSSTVRELGEIAKQDDKTIRNFVKLLFGYVFAVIFLYAVILLLSIIGSYFKKMIDAKFRLEKDSLKHIQSDSSAKDCAESANAEIQVPEAEEDDSSENANSEPANENHATEETLNEIINRNKNSSYEPTWAVGKLIGAGETALIFAPTDQGKSHLAMQVAIEIALGQPSDLVDPSERTNGIPQSVFIYDSEQDEDDIMCRYGKSSFQFPKNLMRISNCSFDDENEFLNNVKTHVEYFKGNYITFILDNVSHAIPTLSGEKVRKFQIELSKIKNVAAQNGLTVTFVFVAHTTKENPSELTLKSLSGSVNWSNFARCIYVLAPTRLGTEYKMLKTLKYKRGRYDSSQVRILRLVDDPYLHFQYQKTMCENLVFPVKLKPIDATKNEPGVEDGLNPYMCSNKLNEMGKQKILELKAKGKSNQEIADEINVSRQTVYNLLQGNKKIEEGA